MPRTGRPHELTPELVEQARQLAESVEFIETIGPILGIGKTGLYTWLKRGSREQRRRDRGLVPKESESIFVDFANAIKKGRALSEKRSLDVIRAAGDAGQWQACAWRLERGNPQRWSLQRSELTRLRKELEELKASLQKGQIRD